MLEWHLLIAGQVVLLAGVVTAVVIWVRRRNRARQQAAQAPDQG
jgi:hypothetical protein